MKWVEMKIVTPSSPDSFRSSAQNRSRAIGSTPDVGSSRIKSSGSCTIATASDSRWRRPSGSRTGTASRTSSRPKRAARVAQRAAASASDRSNRRPCSSRFWRTVSSW
jgi:hypothetical protein